MIVTLTYMNAVVERIQLPDQNAGEAFVNFPGISMRMEYLPKTDEVSFLPTYTPGESHPLRGVIFSFGMPKSPLVGDCEMPLALLGFTPPVRSKRQCDVAIEKFLAPPVEKNAESDRLQMAQKIKSLEEEKKLQVVELKVKPLQAPTLATTVETKTKEKKPQPVHSGSAQSEKSKRARLLQQVFAPQVAEPTLPSNDPGRKKLEKEAVKLIEQLFNSNEPQIEETRSRHRGNLSKLSTEALTKQIQDYQHQLSERDAKQEKKQPSSLAGPAVLALYAMPVVPLAVPPVLVAPVVVDHKETPPVLSKNQKKRLRKQAAKSGAPTRDERNLQRAIEHQKRKAVEAKDKPVEAKSVDAVVSEKDAQKVPALSADQLPAGKVLQRTTLKPFFSREREIKKSDHVGHHGASRAPGTGISLDELQAKVPIPQKQIQRFKQKGNTTSVMFSLPQSNPLSSPDDDLQPGMAQARR